MSKIIVIINQKGGVGKTTTSINLAASFSVLEKKTLLIDADPQGNASICFISEDKKNSFETIDLFNYSKQNKIEYLSTNSNNLKIIPTTIKLAKLEFNGKNIFGSSQDLKKSLEALKKEFEFIVIDCGPSLNFINTSFLSCANTVLIPIQCEYYAMHGLNKLFKVLKTIKNSYNPNLEIEGILITMYDKRLVFSNYIIDFIYKNFDSLVFKTIIHRNVKLAESQSYSKTIIDFDASCIGAINYLSLATEILQKNLEMNKFNLGKKLSEILDENNNSDNLISIFEKLPITNSDNLFNIYNKNLDKLMGLTKDDITSIFGDSFNDKHSNFWMLRLQINGFFKKKYLYLEFENNKVIKVINTYFKKNDVE